VNIEEVSLEPKNPKRQVIDVNLQQEGKNDTPHNILKVEIKNGEVYTLDLTGAQFGYYDAITPWEEYSNTRVERIIVRDGWEEYRHFGGLKEWHMKEANNMSSVDMFQFSQFAGFNFCASEIPDKTTLVWVAAQSLTSIGAMLDLPRAHYQTKKRALLKNIGEDMDAFVVRMTANLAPLSELKSGSRCAPQ
jgi:hypothetical protein